MTLCFRLMALALSLTAAGLFAGESAVVPEVGGELLSDKSEARLNGIAAGRARLLLVAFSGKGGERVRALALEIRKQHSAEELPLVHVAALARVPPMFRGVARKSLRKDIPEQRHAQVLIISDREQEALLRDAIGLPEKGSAFVVGVDAEGRVTDVLAAPEGGETDEVEALISRLL